MTEGDVREYLLHCKEILAPSDMVHEVNALRNLLLFAGNNAVDVCMNHNPGLKPRNKPSRKASMDEETYRRILARSSQIDPSDYPMVRAYTLVLLCLNAGTRNKEIRLAEVDDLDTENWVLHIEHVKGEDSYGQSRDVPIPPEIRQLVRIFLLGRKKTMVDKNCDSHALFPSNCSSDGFCSGNTLRRYKDMVERDLGIKFDLRQCRRTFGQRYLDRDLDIESVSVLMGHSTTRMTETFYSRRRLDSAISKARDAWKEEDEGEKK
jgi:integrase/recombinase XerD